MPDTNTTPETTVEEDVTVDNTTEEVESTTEATTESEEMQPDTPPVSHPIMASFDDGENWYETLTKTNNYGHVTVGFTTLSVNELVDIIKNAGKPISIIFKIDNSDKIVSVYNNLVSKTITIKIDGDSSEVLAQFETLTEEAIKYNAVIDDTDKIKADVDYLAMQMEVEL